MQQWLRELDDEVNTAMMSLDRATRITEKPGPDFRLQVRGSFAHLLV